MVDSLWCSVTVADAPTLISQDLLTHSRRRKLSIARQSPLQQYDNRFPQQHMGVCAVFQRCLLQLPSTHHKTGHAGTCCRLEKLLHAVSRPALTREENSGEQFGKKPALMAPPILIYWPISWCLLLAIDTGLE